MSTPYVAGPNGKGRYGDGTRMLSLDDPRTSIFSSTLTQKEPFLLAGSSAEFCKGSNGEMYPEGRYWVLCNHGYCNCQPQGNCTLNQISYRACVGGAVLNCRTNELSSLCM